MSRLTDIDNYLVVENGQINPSVYEDYKNIMEERGKKI